MGSSRPRNLVSRSSADFIATQLLSSLATNSRASVAVRELVRRLREQNPDDARSDVELEKLIAHMAIAQGLPVEFDGTGATPTTEA